MLYAGKTLEQIAGYDDVFMTYVLFRPRDEVGALIRKEKKSRKDNFKVSHVSKPVSYESMFKQVWKNRGLSEIEIEVKWQEALDADSELKSYIAGLNMNSEFREQMQKDNLADLKRRKLARKKRREKSKLRDGW